MSTNRSASEGSEWERLVGGPPAVAPPVATAPPPVAPDVGSFLRQVFPDMRSAADAVLGALVAGPQAPDRAGPRRDYEAAYALLQRASDAVPALLHHCQQLEGELRRVRSEAIASIETAHGETEQWQQIAVAMKLHIEESEHELAALRTRLATAEERLAAGQSMVEAAEQQASLAMSLSTLFHDKIINAFGAGTPAQAAYEATVKPLRPAPEADWGDR